MKRKTNLLLIILFTLLFIYTVSLLVPFFWALISSFKGKLEFIRNPFAFPKKFLFKNYLVAYKNFFVNVPLSTGGTKKVYMSRMLLNSVIYSVSCGFVTTVATCIMAYAVSKYKCFVSKIIYGIVIVTMILPIVGSLPSEIQISKTFGTFDSIFGMWIMKASFLGMYFLVFYAIFEGISWDYAEAAFVDGASHLRVLTRVMIPLVKTTFLTVFLLNFISYWNDYQTPMIYLPSMPTAAYGMFNYQFSLINEINSPPMQLAGCMILTFPIFIVFLCFRNKLFGNLTAGGIKG